MLVSVQLQSHLEDRAPAAFLHLRPWGAWYGPILGVGKVVARRHERSHSRIPRSDPDSMDVDAGPGEVGD